MKKLGHALGEIVFILFLFYSNLLMGQYERSGPGYTKGFLGAILNVCTLENLTIGIVAAIIGFLFIESFRKALQTKS